MTPSDAPPVSAPTDAALAAAGAYRTPPGAADELFDATGAVRPVWRDALAHIGAMSPDALARRFARGDQYLRDAGVFYRQYGDGGSSERAWPLSHAPVILPESEWRGLEAALIQRADLLEAVMADLYGEARLVREGYLPGALIAASPEWLRPLVGVAPPSGHFLHFVAFDIGRGPGGDWWVLGDRTQAPSGAGFALENRAAVERVFGELHHQANVRGHAAFFEGFRGALLGLRRDRDGHAAVLSPGPMNETYFEHAYIARRLGLQLVEGDDLAVRDGRVWARTISGLDPISVIWRRIDSNYADPLELDETSQLGTPGLIEAIRGGELAMVNALGAGVLETRALLAFLPRICKALRGEPLALPNIATWWCGQPEERAHVLSNAERMVLSPALATTMPLGPEAPAPSDLAAVGGETVGQEAVTLSTTPAFVDGVLQARPMSLRVFLARTPQGWTVMPGGYARIGRVEDPSAISMQRGGAVADVWIVADAASAAPAALSDVEVAEPRTNALAGTLPSRSADNLYWLGRYIERAEGMVRLVRAHHLRLAEAVGDAPLAAYVRDYRRLIGLEQVDGVPLALVETLDAAIGCARRVRDRISVDAWLALSDLVKTAGQLAGTIDGDDSARAMGVLLRKITGIAGLVHENMYRGADWRFMTIGRALERASAMASALAWLTDAGAPDGSLDLAVELGDSAIAHRRRYVMEPSRVSVLELLVFDRRNPRSVLYQLEEIRREAEALPGAEDRGMLSPPLRALLLARASLAAATPETLLDGALLALRADLGAVSDLLADAYMR